MNKSKTCTDTFRLESQPFFELLRKKLPTDKSFTQNLIECKDDMLFGWNSIDCCVIVFNWRLAQSKNEDNIKFQTLIPSSPIDFNVTKLTASHEGQYIALSGNRGVAILEIPSRYGPNGSYKEGKPKILCNTNVLDEHFLCTNHFVNIQQVRWHPASPKDCTLLVLLSNNSIRVYEESKLQHIWKIGPTPCAFPPTKSSLPFLNSLGDTAVDFDIAAPRVTLQSSDNITNNETFSTTTTTKLVEWPLTILWGNGDIFILQIGVDTDKPRLQGPLSVYPTTKDNYGLDSCAILALQSNPTVVVVAQPNGRLFHMILVETDPIEQQDLENFDESGIKIEPCEWIVNVIESVELELGLKEQSNKNHENYPIYLKADINNDSRYFAYHDAGLHAITIEFMPQLQRYFDDSGETSLENALNKMAHAEYLVCTKALNNAKPNPILGFSLLQSPSGLVLFLNSGQVVSLDVITNPSILPKFKNTANETENNTFESAISSKVFSSGSFEETIRQILSTGVTQPILKLDNTKNTSPKECIEFMLSSFQLLRDQYITKHDQVRQKMENRVKILRVLEEQQRQEIAELNVEKGKLRENAERLAELYEETSDRQQNILQKLHEIHRLLNERIPMATVAERNFSEQINKIHTITRELTNNIALAKKKMEKQQLHLTTDTSKKDITLHPKQEAVLKEILDDSNKQIETQIKEINNFKKVLNIE